MKLSRLVVVGTALFAVSACAGTDGGAFSASGDLSAAKEMRASAPFNEALRTGYIELAEGGVSQEDWIDAGIFARKAVRAGNDEAVLPEELDRWGVPESMRSQLSEARSTLISVLDGNARTSSPETAAEAQVMFDCWVEKSESVYWLLDDCQGRFDAAMSELTGRQMTTPPPAAAEPPARDYLVFFDFDRSNLRQDAISILNSVVSAYESLDAGSVSAIGHADRSGPDTYNQGLSERRSAAVRQYLAGQGIPDSDISTSGRGESDPRVPTPDGVREQENRRVEINLN